MKLDSAEIDAIADALAPRVAEILERRLSERPELAMSIPEAAVYAQVEEHTIRNAIRVGRLPCFKVGHSTRIRRADLFRVQGEGS